MARRQPSRPFFCCELLPARSRFASRGIGGLLLVSLLAVQVLPVAWRLTGAQLVAGDHALAVAGEGDAEAIAPIAERRCHSEGSPKRVKAVDAALDDMARSRPAPTVFCAKDSDRHPELRRTGTLVDLHVRLQI